MPRSKDKQIHEERTQQILEAAQIVFSQKGFADTRMDDIAKEAGLSKGSLYLYFKSKQEVVSQLLMVTFEMFRKQLTSLIESDEPAEQVLLAYVKQSSSYLEQDASASNIAYEFYAAAAHQADMKEYLRQFFRDYHSILVKLFKKSIARGDYPPFDTNTAAVTLMAQLEGMSLLWFTDPENLQLEPMLTASIQTIFKGLVYQEEK